MALIKCPDCGIDVSDAAPACPKCGRPAGPIVAPNGFRQRTPPREKKRTSTVSITLSSFALILIGFVLAVCFVPAFQIGQHVEARCQVNGLGSGTCQFTNTGWTPGSQCVAVRLVNKQGGAVSSGPLCSGRIWPNDTAQRDVSMVVGNNCDAVGAAWNDVCAMDIHNLTGSGDDELAERDSSAPAPHDSAIAPAQTMSEAASPATAVLPVTTDTGQPLTSGIVPVPQQTAPMTPESSNQAQEQNQPQPDTPSSSAVLQKVIDDVNGPSFDCSTATDVSARAICGNAQLSQLDRQMAILYYTRTNYKTDPAVRDQQRAWIRNRNQLCVADAVCLAKELNQRISQLQAQ